MIQRGSTQTSSHWYISSIVAQVCTNMPLQTTNSDQNNLMFLVRFWVLKEDVELVWTFMLQDDHVMGSLGFSKPIASEKQMKSCCSEFCLKWSRCLSLLPSHSHQCVTEYFFSFYLHIWAVSQKPYPPQHCCCSTDLAIVNQPQKPGAIYTWFSPSLMRPLPRSCKPLFQDYMVKGIFSWSYCIDCTLWWSFT